MRKAKLAGRSRAHLDERFRKLRPPARFAPPVRGWIKAIRTALGMSTAQLAKRLRVKQPSVVALEQSETKGTMELATLRRVAAALDCTLVYALVPNKPLEATVRDRARVPAGAVAVLINKNHTFTDLYLPIDARRNALLESVDGTRTIGELCRPGERELARSFFEDLWHWDQVVFDRSAAAG